MKIENIAIADVKPYEKNARKHPTKQIDLLVANIKRFGFTTPILVDKDNNLIAGHGRLEALKKMGTTEVPAVRMENLTPEEVKALRLADNQVAQMGEWDMELVTAELRDLDSGLLDLTGFSSDLIVVAEDRDDVVPDTPADTISQLGDVYQLGPHRVICGDSTSLADLLIVMDGKRAKMVFTDPPYNIDYQGGMHADGTQTKRRKILNDKMSSDQFYTFLHNLFTNLVSVTDGAFYVCMSSSELHNLWKAFTDAGGHWQQYVIWAKDNFTLSRTDYQQQFEPILYGLSEKEAEVIENATDHSDGEAIMYGWTKHDWYGGRKQGNVWFFDRPRQSKEHPTMKPVMLCVKAIMNSSLPGEIVVDTFLGSGTTLIAAEKTGRVCYGIELDPHYVDVIVQRYLDFTGQKEVIRNGEKVVWEDLTKANG